MFSWRVWTNHVQQKFLPASACLLPCPISSIIQSLYASCLWFLVKFLYIWKRSVRLPLMTPTLRKTVWVQSCGWPTWWQWSGHRGRWDGPLWSRRGGRWWRGCGGERVEQALLVIVVLPLMLCLMNKKTSYIQTSYGQQQNQAKTVLTH